MKRIAILIFLLLLQFTMFAQKENIIDSLYASLDHRKLNGFISLVSDITINEHIQFASTGIGAAFLFGNKFFIGGYGLGLVSTIQKSDILTDNTMLDYHLNYAHGGLWLGIIDSPCKRFHSSFSIKMGWGALFMYNINSPITYNLNRDEFIVITPQIETDIFITNWLRINFGLGVRFISGFSAQYKDSNGNFNNIYNSSEFEGFIASFSLNFGSFCNQSSKKK